MQLVAFPETDWSPKEIHYSRGPSAAETVKCEFCGRKIRWLHIIEHVDYHRPVTAGRDCAAHRCYDYDAAEAERKCRNRTERLRQFVACQKWFQSRSNPENIWRWVKLSGRKKLRVTVFLRDGQYSVSVSGPKQNQTDFGLKSHRSQLQAMHAAFDLVESRKDET